MATNANGHAKMTREERAKQFMPFAALKGYEDALRAKEKIVVPRISLTDEMKDELDRTMRTIGKMDMVRVVYFKDGEYLEIKGLVASFDVTSRIIRVVNTKIGFEDILEIEKIKNIS